MNTTSNLITGKNFSEALEHLKDGAIAYREGWNGIKRGINMYVMLIDSHEAYDPHFIFYNAEHQSNNIWVPSMWDMMAEDWVIQTTHYAMTDSTGQAVEYGLDGGKMPQPQGAIQ